MSDRDLIDASNDGYGACMQEVAEPLRRELEQTKAAAALFRYGCQEAFDWSQNPHSDFGHFAERIVPLLDDLTSALPATEVGQRLVDLAVAGEALYREIKASGGVFGPEVTEKLAAMAKLVGDQ